MRPTLAASMKGPGRARKVVAGVARKPAGLRIRLGSNGLQVGREATLARFIAQKTSAALVEQPEGQKWPRWPRLAGAGRAKGSQMAAPDTGFVNHPTARRRWPENEAMRPTLAALMKGLVGPKAVMAAVGWQKSADGPAGDSPF